MGSARIVFAVGLAAGYAEAGFVPAALDRWRDELARRRTTGLLLVEDGKIVYEWYWPG
jgi:hypothetical protein